MTTYSVSSDVFPAVLVVSPSSAPAPASIYARNEDLIASGSRKLEKVRVITMSSPAQRVIIYQDSPSGPAVIFQDDIASFTPAPSRASRFNGPNRSLFPEYTLTTTSGKTLAYYRTGGCGCGSRLKSFNPFSSLTAVASSQNAPPVNHVLTSVS